MSHQCSCGRDLNNNYVGYTSAYANANTGLDRDANSSTKSSSGAQTQFTAKLLVGTVGAIKELREKEKSRHSMARAADRRN
ncbi:uncharacterized protein LOC131806544 [Musca domestica]|uniref:Uncharacterized protein LOC101898364 n=1 Tax=Musca domestica TaxID=7370 RepID=A0A1I8MAC5_MUSDO|nr:uncharacterized protein LOC101898364 [Musca domestica]XP_058986714.1 uncharacterized protein LOC131806544 [Musca domestica]